MNKTLLLIGLLLPGIAQAVICKIVDPQGGITYTDVPLEECPQEVSMPDYSRYAPRPIQPQGMPALQPPPLPAQPIAGYHSIRILQPANDAVVRNNEGRVPVAIALDPVLQPEHLITVFLDGNAVASSLDGGATTLNGVERGTHRLLARVVDPSGRTLIESPAVSFTLRKFGLNDPTNQPKPELPVSPPTYQPPSGSDYGGHSTPNYDPAGSSSDAPKTKAGISHTPGQTNPAFKPKYNP